MLPTQKGYALYCSNDSCSKSVSLVEGTPDNIIPGFPIDETFYRESVCVSSSSINESLLVSKPSGSDSYKICKEECLNDEFRTYEFIFLHDTGKWKIVSLRLIFKMSIPRLLLCGYQRLQKSQCIGVPRHLRFMQSRQ